MPYQACQVVLLKKNKLYKSLEQNNSKPLWFYNKSRRQDGNGVSPLKESDQLHSYSEHNAKILNNQFCSVFTSDDTTNIPKFLVPPNTEMPKFVISVKVEVKVLMFFKGKKASRPLFCNMAEWYYCEVGDLGFWIYESWLTLILIHIEFSQVHVSV